jgi:hypothetical protein
MESEPVLVYYLKCRETGCWALFDTRNLTNPICRKHGHLLNARGINEGLVTEFEAKRGWTWQKPD